MSDLIPRISLWLLQSLVVGGVVLLLAAIVVAVVRQPIRRKQIATWGLRAALLVPILTIGPSWIHLSLPARAVPPIEEKAIQPSPASSSPTTTIVSAGFPNTVRPFGALTPPSPQPSPPIKPRGEEPGNASPSLVPAAAASPGDLRPAGRGIVERVFAGFSPVALVLGMFLAASGLFATRWLIGHVAVLRIVRGSRHGDGRVAGIFAEQAAEFADPPRLLVSDRLTVPVCFGLWRPTVLLPAALADSADETTLRWIIAHELAHLRNGDAWSGIWFGVAQALYFPLPWFWWLKRRLSLCQEYLADAAAASLTGRAEDYAECLLNLSHGIGAVRPSLAATGVLGRPSDLFRRISTLLKERDSMTRRSTLTERVLTAAVFVAVAIALAGIGLNRSTSAVAQEQSEKKEPAKKDEPKKDDPKPVPPAGFDPLDFNKQFEKMQEQMKKQMEEHQKRFEESRKHIEEMQKQLRDRNFGPIMRAPGFQGVNPFGGFGGFNSGNARLGAAVEKPSAVLVDQLDLPKDQGLVLGDLTANGAAAKAGLKPNDILLEIGGKAVASDPNEFRKQLGEVKANSPVDAVVLRKGKKETIKGISLPEAKDDAFGLPGFDGGGFGIEFGPNGIQMKNLPIPPGIPDIKQLVQPFAGENANTMHVEINNDQFTIRSTRNGLDFTVSGAMEDGKPKLESVTIVDGKEKVTADKLDKVPEKYKDEVQKLLKSVSGKKK